jgi:hypothetical protein
MQISLMQLLAKLYVKENHCAASSHIKQTTALVGSSALSGIIRQVAVTVPQADQSLGQVQIY